jgi:antitoxin ChpS
MPEALLHYGQPPETNMATAHVREIDGHVMLQLAPETAAALALKPNAPVDVQVNDGSVTLVPYRRRRYTMSELLENFELMPKDAEEDRIWLNSPPVGRELI